MAAATLVTSNTSANGGQQEKRRPENINDGNADNSFHQNGVMNGGERRVNDSAV